MDSSFISYADIRDELVANSFSSRSDRNKHSQDREALREALDLWIGDSHPDDIASWEKVEELWQFINGSKLATTIEDIFESAIAFDGCNTDDDVIDRAFKIARGGK